MTDLVECPSCYGRGDMYAAGTKWRNVHARERVMGQEWADVEVPDCSDCAGSGRVTKADAAAVVLGVPPGHSWEQQ